MADQAGKDARKKFDPDFFTLPSLPTILISLIMQYFMFTAAFAPDTFPAFLGFVGTYARDFGINHHKFCLVLIIVTYGVHVIESIRAGNICRELQLTPNASRKWTITVFIFGIFSLHTLQSLRKLKAA